MVKSLFLLIPVLLVSCNLYKVADKHIDKKMEKASMARKTVVVKGDTIDFWDGESDKPVFVLVHGFGATTKYQWFKQIEMLSEDYRVLMPNLLHFGKTKAGSEKFSVRAQMEMVHNFINQQGIESYVLGGVSYGGLISLELARNYPKGIEKLVIIDAPMRFMTEGDLYSVQEKFEVSSIEELFAPSNEKGLKKLMYLATMKKSIVPASWLTEFYDDLYASNLVDKRRLITNLIGGLEEYQQYSYSNITIPTLLVWGSNDPIIPADRGQLLEKHIGENATYAEIKKGAHMPCLTKTRKFNKTLSEFLRNE